ncbi:MAG: 4Fe-4S dicluster domain-containing protein [Candidatus Mcinerneyibacterium aminivorans]|uniref:4Fe-4S dicluster domain-containing protein n=1 Tax=Candidatus Mcinerneyibacterium aminivorans TaxID=2703815 RepID=A0A5D0MKJ6_9BACT|nr:MAG: 4Fe-4S dicluster domain-containing protein [Candidatus Mcinerneyibacterium aminivorans]
MKLPSLFQFRVLKEALKSIFSPRYTSKYPAVSHVPPKKFRGKPEFNEKECVGCKACAEVCPTEAIEVVDDVEISPPNRKFLHHYDLCIFCGHCEANCITEKGIVLEDEYDLAVFDRDEAFTSIDKELIICEDCGEIIGAKDHLIYLAKKLGPLAYGNFPLIMTAQKELKIVNRDLPSTISGEKRRTDMFNVLCPKCRSEILINIGGSENEED